MRVLWTIRRSNQSILKEINPEYSLEGRILKLKLQQFGHLMGKTDSLEKTLMLGKIDVHNFVHLTKKIMYFMYMGLSKLQQLVIKREVWRAAVHVVAKS